MDLGVSELLFGLAALFLLLYYYCTSTYNYWSSKRVAGPKPILLFGNLKDVLLNKVSIGDFLYKLYAEYKNEPMVGIFSQRTPSLVIIDPELIKDVLIKDFSTFSDRGVTAVHKKIDPLAQHLVALEPARWRPLRTKLSPVFTSRKLKEMFYLLMECGEHFEKFMDKYVKKNPIIECRDLTARFTTDVIGVCAFGLKMNALDDEDSQFRKVGRKIFDMTLSKIIRIRIRETMPWLFNLLGPLMYEHEINDFFIETMIQTMNYRKKNNIKRNDFVDLLMAIRDDPSKIGDIEMTDTFITAQAFVFFAAGFETSSTAMSNALYELALDQSLQNKLRAEINEELQKHDGKLTYESIKNMKYMHKIFCETLRKYPPVTTIFRKSIKPYTFSGSTQLTIPENTKVWIPVYALQHDPEIYPNPDTFDPERFDEEVVKNRHPSYFLPFGDGPRNCIGARFANYQAKVGLVKVVCNYRVDICENTRIPYVNNPKSFLLQPIDGIKLKFIKI